MALKTVRMKIFGIVQGVGFRPFMAVSAEKTGVCGTVANKGSYVEAIVQGSGEQIDRYADIVRNSPPERSVILGLDIDPCEDGEFPEFADFRIIESKKEYGDIFVSPDIATCDKCRTELFDKNDRRYLHPFINCTQCGPRLTILDTMPYDRVRTSMGEFPMCSECDSEYHDPATRRYDAQPVCCNDCGPRVRILGTDIFDGDAIRLIRREIMAGKVAAVKGIGGFHLCCDAHNAAAVARLRELKRRPMKPFAVMMRDFETTERECFVAEGQREYLTGWQKPILLLERRPDSTLSEQIAPDNDTVGVMLPYAPVQMLLFDYPDGLDFTDCLVMTSGNARGAPICRSDEDALAEIPGFCDYILTHDRKIRIRADDSVCDWLFGKPYMIRRSRGFAPLPVMLHGGEGRQAIGIGGELKNTFCIARNGLLYASPYVGDMADIRTVRALKESVHRMIGLLEAEPEVIVCDTHPMYNTVTVAEELAEEMGLPLVKIQHHFAHILSCMAENRLAPDSRVIGVSFDGTGYGDDGTIWGGELMICGYGSYERVGSVAPFMQCGGDLSSKEGWRIAVQLIRQGFGEDAQAVCERLGLCDAKTFKIQSAMADKRVNSVLSTSCGRIFDAVSAILGIRQASTFEGEASTALMTAAERYVKQNGETKLTLPIEMTADTESGSGFITLGSSALAAEIARRFMDGGDAGQLAFEFHAALSELIRIACIELREKHGLNEVALSGGVFQNRLLVKLTKAALEKAGFTVLLHTLIPPNDGGICVGQAAHGVLK
ncbi:hydrogenase maturation protein HypF [Ruminococcus sp. YE71]|nr:hydrogenase maturation protein HypF [Ruminococcus sp. YE78]SFW16214.1 hydrogenase maturation protein HypF [Ruminococcus sp. YE71]